MPSLPSNSSGKTSQASKGIRECQRPRAAAGSDPGCLQPAPTPEATNAGNARPPGFKGSRLPLPINVHNDLGTGSPCLQKFTLKTEEAASSWPAAIIPELQVRSRLNVSGYLGISITVPPPFVYVYVEMFM